MALARLVKLSVVTISDKTILFNVIKYFYLICFEFSAGSSANFGQ